MRSMIPVPVLIRGILLTLLVCGGVSTTGRADLPGAVRRAVERSGIPITNLGLSIRETATGREIINYAGATPRIPASNMKLLTTGAVLETLPGDHRFTTRLVIDGPRILLIGDGDPALADPDLLEEMVDESGRALDVEDLLALWVDQIRATGLTEIDELLIDDRVFDQEFLHPDWPRDQIERHYCAEVGGLNFHRNVIALRPQIRGGRIDLQESPASPFLPLDNRLKIGTDPQRENLIDPHRPVNAAEIRILGTISRPQKAPVEVTIHDPPLYTGQLLADRLRQVGIPVGRLRRASEQDRPTAPTLAFQVVTPLTEVTRECNRDSKNLYAEALLKYLGHVTTGDPGSWANGGPALRDVVRHQIGEPPTGLAIADGSGMSRNNRIPPSLMTRWLDALADGTPASQHFDDSLATPGSGTLRSRFRNRDLHGCRVLAKTGFIRGVSALSGYVIAPDGRRYAFSVMGNDLKNIRRCKTLQEDVVTAIAAELARTSTTVRGPASR